MRGTRGTRLESSAIPIAKKWEGAIRFRLLQAPRSKKLTVAKMTMRISPVTLKSRSSNHTIKPFTRLVEEGTFIASHNGELLNNKSEWHQASCARSSRSPAEAATRWREKVSIQCYWIKNGLILPTGQWYAPSAGVNNALIMYYLAISCTILQYLALSCTILHYLALSCTILHYLALSCTIFHYLALSCTILHYLALSCT